MTLDGFEGSDSSPRDLNWPLILTAATIAIGVLGYVEWQWMVDHPGPALVGPTEPFPRVFDK